MTIHWLFIDLICKTAPRRTHRRVCLYSFLYPLFHRLSTPGYLRFHMINWPPRGCIHANPRGGANRVCTRNASELCARQRTLCRALASEIPWDTFSLHKLIELGELWSRFSYILRACPTLIHISRIVPTDVLPVSLVELVIGFPVFLFLIGPISWSGIRGKKSFILLASRD